MIAAAYLTARGAAKRVRNEAMATALRGGDVECPVCDGRFRRFLHDRNSVCPRCRSRARHRLLSLYLARETDVLERPRRILHFAPEPMLSAALRKVAGDAYLSGDIDPRKAMRRLDMTAIDLPDASFDLVLVNHVFEHVPDDQRAMREVRRVLAPGGMLITQHPVDYTRETTYEDPSITTREARKAAFRHPEHLRVFGRDFPDRLRGAGFEVELVRYRDEVGEDARRRYGLGDGGEVRGDDIYVGRVPATP